MKNTMKIAFYSFIGIILLGLNNANALITPTGAPIQGGIIGSQNSAEITIQNYITNFLTFLAVLAVIYGLWGGFQIMTAAGDEEKVKKGKTVIIQVAIGIFVIFLANSLVKFLIGIVTGA